MSQVEAIGRDEVRLRTWSRTVAPQVSRMGSKSSAAPSTEPPLVARRWLLSAHRSAASNRWSIASAASVGACCQACQPRKRLLKLCST